MGAFTISRASVTGLPICDEGIEIAQAVLPTRRRLTFAVSAVFSHPISP